MSFIVLTYEIQAVLGIGSSKTMPVVKVYIKRDSDSRFHSAVTGPPFVSFLFQFKLPFT